MIRPADPIPGASCPGVSPGSLTEAGLDLAIGGAASVLWQSGVRLNDAAACALILIDAGYPGSIVGRILDQAIARAAAPDPFIPIGEALSRVLGQLGGKLHDQASL
jgi:hypothetical protein